jgi:hypothetical protein
MTPAHYTPPTDYRRELLAFPVDGDGNRCPPGRAVAIRVCGRLDCCDVPLSVWYWQSPIPPVTTVIRGVVPYDARPDAGALQGWAEGLWRYLGVVEEAVRGAEPAVVREAGVRL